MIFSKTTAYGLDKKIKLLQEELQDYLPWFETVEDSQIAIYDKIYRLANTEGKFVPEAHISGGEYKQVFNDDTLSVTIGFYPIRNRNITLEASRSPVDIICTVDLSKIYPGNVREDEMALRDMLRVLEEAGYVTSFNEIKEGVQNVFNGFYTEDIKFNDIQPRYCFSVNVELEYCNAEYCSGDSIDSHASLFLVNNSNYRRVTEEVCDGTAGQVITYSDPLSIAIRPMIDDYEGNGIKIDDYDENGFTIISLTAGNFGYIVAPEE